MTNKKKFLQGLQRVLLKILEEILLGPVAALLGMGIMFLILMFLMSFFKRSLEIVNGEMGNRKRAHPGTSGVTPST